MNPLSPDPAASRPRGGARAIRDQVAVATAESLNHDGRGVARVHGKVTFIEGALPGEEVRFRYGDRRKTYDSGAALEILKPSADRVPPACPHFGVCGGCSLQHLRPEAQIRAKQQVLAENLARIGRVMPEQWLAPLTGPAWHYRRRARLGVRFVPNKGGALVGFREKHRSFIAPLGSCAVLAEKVSGLLPALKELVGALSCPDRIPQIEVAAADNATAFVLRHLVPLTEEDLQKLCLFGSRYDVQMHVQGGGPETVRPLWPESPEPLYYRIPEYDLRLEFGPSDFIQINGAMNNKMVHQAIALLDLKPGDRTLDLFCGLGNFTLPLARKAARVLGIEADSALIGTARRNAALNGLANVEFRTADLYAETAAAAPWQDFRFDSLLLDPPRSGALEAMRRLAEPLPERIVYVSCDPATLARDSGYLVNARAYRLAAAGVLDMFPHTSHVESMAVFTRL